MIKGRIGHARKLELICRQWGVQKEEEEGDGEEKTRLDVHCGNIIV